MLGTEDIARIAASVTAEGPGESAIAALRRDWPGVHFTYQRIIWPMV